MTEQINTTSFKESLLELSRDTADDASSGGSHQEQKLKINFSLTNALEELSTIHEAQKMI